MNKKQRQNIIVILIIFVIVITVGISYLLLSSNLLKTNINNGLSNSDSNTARQACTQITKKERQNRCLAIVNKDRNLCNNVSEDDILACQAIVENKPELCTKVELSIQKKTCVNEVARVNSNINSCDFADDKKDCVGSYLAGLYWDKKFDLMDQKYCDIFFDGDKNWCLALVTQDKSVCSNNPACLSLFVQPLSFCNNQQMSKSNGECLRDRAMTQADPNICDLINDINDKNRCFFNIVGHINPDISLCSKISDPELEQECLSNAAVKILLNTQE